MDNFQPNLELITEGLPLDLEEIFKDTSRIIISPDEISRFDDLPASLESTIKDIRGLDEFNNFSRWRSPYKEQLRLIVHELFSQYGPRKDGLIVLEVGPGPKAYALKHKIMPLERISRLTMLELSDEYYRKVEKYSRSKSHSKLKITAWHEDMHTIKLTEEHPRFDVVYCSSSLDSTKFIGLAMKNIPNLLNDGEDSAIIITQDLYPDSSSILALASQRRIKLGLGGSVTYGFSNIEKVNGSFFWIEDERGLKCPSSTYLVRELARYALQEKLKIKKQGILGASLSVSPEDRQRYGIIKKLMKDKMASPEDNCLIGYQGMEITHRNPNIKRGCLAVKYFTDVLVVGK